MIVAGASIVDIGGRSTRPGAMEISHEDEWKRIEPVLRAVRKTFPDICISVDTYLTDIAEKALDNGADMINDISGGTFDENMAPLIGKRNVPYVIMHIQGRPGNMQQNPVYNDVVEDIASFFEKQIITFQEHGASQLILDPGFGFGKTLKHNYKLLKDLKRFTSFGYPILAGISRKSMINKVIGTLAEDALNGTTALNTIALLNGASILRVHDVKEAVETIKLVENL
jgi:dihydropteroate synthase